MTTSDQTIANVAAVGDWGAGKTAFIGVLTKILENERGVLRVDFVSDRLYFEETVREDTAGWPVQPDGSIIGPSSILEKDGPPGHMSFRVLEGRKFNEAHRKMLHSLSVSESGVIRTVEFATGPKKSIKVGEPLDQTGHFFVRNLIKSGAHKNTFVVELLAPMSVRRKRNDGRDDPTDKKAFEIYGQSGGEISLIDRLALGRNYVRIRNEHVALEVLVRDVFEKHLKQRLFLDEGYRPLEGNRYSRR